MVRLTSTCAVAGALLSTCATAGNLRGDPSANAKAEAEVSGSEQIPADILDIVDDLRFIDPFEGFDYDQVVPDDETDEQDGSDSPPSVAQDRQAFQVDLDESESKHSKFGGHFREEEDMDVQEVEARIVGGSMVNVNDWKPWMAMTLDEINGQTYRGVCGAAMITNQWAVTAAHCVSNYNTNDLVHKMDWLYVGALRPWASNAGKNYQKIQISQIYEHPQHDAGAAEPHDIALLKLASPVTFSGFYSLKLPNYSPANTPANRRGVAYGFGQTSYGATKANELRSVEVGHVPNSVCDDAMDDWDITSDMVCFAAPNKDSCGGDSGGPIVVNGDTLFGVVSWGYKCAEPGYPGVYSSTYEHRGWMQTTMGSAWNSVQRTSNQGSLTTYAGSQYSSQTGYSTSNSNPAPAPAPAPVTYSQTDINRQCVKDEKFEVEVSGQGKFKCKDAAKKKICNKATKAKGSNKWVSVKSICCEWCDEKKK